MAAIVPEIERYATEAVWNMNGPLTAPKIMM